MQRLRAAPSESAQIQDWFALAVEEADRYIDRDFTAAPTALEWIPGIGWDDGWESMWGPTRDAEVLADADLPRAVFEGVLAFVRVLRMAELREPGIISHGAGQLSETRKSSGAGSAYNQALEAARGYWDPIMLSVLRKGAAV
jgi:hypothetical protein